jgi:1-pyrroline-5-carboxylate dehydrogenase
MLKELATIKVGGVEDFSNFMNAVIDEKAFRRVSEYIACARKAKEAQVLFGGEADASRGYFIQPTLLQASDPQFRTMREEIFGPVLSVYVYADEDYEEALHLCDQTSPYGLTGAVFAREREAAVTAQNVLVNAAGNFYINDKPTGAVVGQQPFGGGRASGTNDKAGCCLNLQRWVNPRAIKETFVPPVDYRYPFMAES